jgi:hypothetical protein
MDMEIEKDFKFEGLPAIDETVGDLGPLRLLHGKWKGEGFNLIWRPFHSIPPNPPQNRFLELNLTTENLEFDQIVGTIPNRGFLQDDIPMAALIYLQKSTDRNIKIKNSDLNAGIHVETGIWVTVPGTEIPNEPDTIVRMASIPHGTTILAQGTAKMTIDHAPEIPPVSIKPFPIGDPRFPVFFPESDLSIPTAFRSPKPQLVGITQQTVNDPNSVLRTAIAEQVITETTILKISSKLGVLPAPDAGGGTNNIAFLAGTAAGPNALAAEIDATFWIETVKEPSGDTLHQLQYSQIVLLNFNYLSWPHVSVATLRRQPAPDD